MKTEHSFHIPVMGTGFTIDTPLKVARFGISSVVSAEDHLMEAMREHYSTSFKRPFKAILANEPDARARRVTAYFNFMNECVNQQIEDLKLLPFEPGSEIVRYFELLDDASSLKKDYLRMLELDEPQEKTALQSRLRSAITPGSIDMNILTKLDRQRTEAGKAPLKENSDAMAAFRGFASSDVNGSIVFSAGVNLHLFSYVEKFDDFFPDANGNFKKKIILKVNDFRSACTQGKIFAKKGLWVSEYRLESGLNCGGHAFGGDGKLMGPALEDFRNHRESFLSELFEIYKKALFEKKQLTLKARPYTRVTAQGGIGTHAEHRFLIRHYQLDSVGWGTPFLLVPEATSVDADTMQKLAVATEEDVELADCSPMGVPIYSLKNSKSEKKRLERIENGTPGSPCPNGYMAFNTEFGPSALCVASGTYQGLKIKKLKEEHLSEDMLQKKISEVTVKTCLCHNLGVGALIQHGIQGRVKVMSPAVCPGPNIAYFSKIVSLREMIGHIYGRNNLLDPSSRREHVFINELHICVKYFKKLIQQASASSEKEFQKLVEFKKHLTEGIEYYRTLTKHLLEETEESRERFLVELEKVADQLETLFQNGETSLV